MVALVLLWLLRPLPVDFESGLTSFFSLSAAKLTFMRMDGLLLRPVRSLIFSQAVACCFDTCWRDIGSILPLMNSASALHRLCPVSSELCLHFVVRLVGSGVGS